MASTEGPQASAHNGTLHFIPPNLCAFEPTKALVRSMNINTLIWVGGLGDTMLSVSYPLSIAQALGPTWSMVTTSLSSAGNGFGVSSIARDAEELGKTVAYFKQRRPGGKICLMGHSTGCQDCMEYLVGAQAKERPAVDGVVLQAPVSDREAITNGMPAPSLHAANELALKMCREGHDKDAIPNAMTKPFFGRVAVSARRWVDLASPGPDHTGADDYFSSDLPDARLKTTLGRLPPTTPLLLLYSGSEENVPSSINKSELVSRWTRIVQESGGNVDDVNGGVVPSATHNLNGNAEAVVRDLAQRLVGFIDRLDKGDFHPGSRM